MLRAFLDDEAIVPIGFVCLYFCLFRFYRQEIFTCMETSPLPVKSCRKWAHKIGRQLETFHV